MVPFGVFYFMCGTAEEEIHCLINEMEQNFLSGWISLC